MNHWLEILAFVYITVGLSLVGMAALWGIVLLTSGRPLPPPHKTQFGIVSAVLLWPLLIYLVLREVL